MTVYCLTKNKYFYQLMFFPTFPRTQINKNISFRLISSTDDAYQWCFVYNRKYELFPHFTYFQMYGKNDYTTVTFLTLVCTQVKRSFMAQTLIHSNTYLLYQEKHVFGLHPNCPFSKQVSEENFVNIFLMDFTTH